MFFQKLDRFGNIYECEHILIFAPVQAAEAEHSFGHTLFVVTLFVNVLRLVQIDPGAVNHTQLEIH